VIVCFVDIGEIVDHHYLNFLVILTHTTVSLCAHNYRCFTCSYKSLHY